MLKQTERLTNQKKHDIRATFQAKEIEEHKYYLSQQKGKDVGLQESVEHWVDDGYAQRFASDFDKNKERIYASCSRDCRARNCFECELSMERIHQLMQD